MVSFYECETPTNLFEIEMVENFVGFTFPDLYREHLLKFNGGRCEPNIFEFRVGEEIEDSLVGWFYAIYDGDHYNLRKNISILKHEEKRMPLRMLPIADDQLGNVICISCLGEDTGTVYFWDHEKEVNYRIVNDNDMPNMHFVAPSLSDFFNVLHK